MKDVSNFKYTGIIAADYNGYNTGYDSVYLNELPKNSTDLVEIWEISKTKKGVMDQFWIWGISIIVIKPNSHYKSN